MNLKKTLASIFFATLISHAGGVKYTCMADKWVFADGKVYTFSDAEILKMGYTTFTVYPGKIRGEDGWYQFKGGLKKKGAPPLKIYTNVRTKTNIGLVESKGKGKPFVTMFHTGDQSFALLQCTIN